MSGQFSRIVSALESTLDSLRAGPKPQGNKESYTQFMQRAQVWDSHKRRFVVYAIQCLRHYDLDLAIFYSKELRHIKPIA